MSRTYAIIAGILIFAIGTQAQTVIISEFMASNSRALADEDGSYEDWIELYNASSNAVDLSGWSLTDSPTDLTKWRFPSTNLNAGTYLVVFASGKDRRIPGRPLHTNFRLDGKGEYLALVEPDGRSIATQFSPKFPQQFADVSFGLGQVTVEKKLISTDSPVKIKIPTDGAYGSLWTGVLFDDSSWIQGTNGVGFDFGEFGTGETYAPISLYYSFDENNANSTVGSLNGVLNGSPTFTTGRAGGRSISLNGVNQYIAYPAYNFGDVFSISLWVKPTLKDNIQTIAANTTGGFTTAGFKFFINQYQTSNGLINFETGNGSAGAITRSIAPVDWDQWNFIVVVVNRPAGRATIYKNGVNVTDPANYSVNTTFTTSATWEVGRMLTSGFYLQGQIDDFCVWQGALSPSQIAALAAGAIPTNLAIFKQYIKTDISQAMYGVNASAYIRIPFYVDNPDAIQTLKLRMRYDDGFVAYLNGVELLRRNAPFSGQAGDSTSDLSGVQGANNWYYGYYDKTADPDQIYQTNNFIPFPSSGGTYGTDNYWTGAAWDWYNGNPPWTELTSTGGHPNGSNNGNIHWAIRRWVSPYSGTVKLTLRHAKSNPNCGNGTTTRVFHNGVEKFSNTIAYNNTAGITTNIIIYNVKVGDLLDFAIDPTGTDGQPTDPCDGTIFTISIEFIPPPELTYNSTATMSHPNILGIQFEEFDIYPFRRWLNVGNNVLAIQGLNIDATNGDFFIEAELVSSTATSFDTNIQRYFAIPTPGAPNGRGEGDLGPIIKNVTFAPSEPADNEDIIVTAQILPTFSPIKTNILYYRVMFGSEVPLQMLDDGNNGDGAPNDGVYGAIIPASASTAGQMVRWYIVSMDSSNRVSRFPILTDTNRCPIYMGTVVQNPALTNPLPVFHWFIQNPTAADSDAGTRCSVYFNGIFYDNVFINIHGQSSRGFPKKSYDIEFNPGYHFYYDLNKPPVSDINFMTTYPDKAHMRNILAYETYRDAGCAYHWVIPARVQQNNTFWGDIHLMENGDNNWLERLGLDPDGALYKMYNTFNSSPSHAVIGGNNAEKKTRKYEGNADLLALLNGVLQANTINRRAFLYDNIDIPQMINFLAARIITGDQDCCHKNYYLYRDSNKTRLWQAFPWDVDLSFGRRWISSLTYWDDTMVIDTRIPTGDNNGLFNALFTTPEIEQMYYRRIRTLMDELLQPPDTPPSQLKYEKRIDELTAILAPDAALDLAKWGTWGNGSAQSTCCIQTQPQAAEIIKTNYLPQRRVYLFVNKVITAGGKIPLAQPPDTKIEFGAIEATPASGNQLEEYIQLTNINNYAVDISGWRLEGAIKHKFSPGTVIPSNGVLYVTPDINAFKGRTVGPRGGQGLFVQGNYNGQLSARGETIVLLDNKGRYINKAEVLPNPSLAQQYLRVTEIMYNPVAMPGDVYDAQMYEYIELKNIGDVDVPLSGIRFTNGIYFDFSTGSITNLAPGETVLVVKNINAFISRYGSGKKIVGEYVGSLDNAGERIVLIDARGEEILDFSYNNGWYKLTDGSGFALVVKNENAQPDAWDSKSNWQTGSVYNGTPGLSEPPPPQIKPVLINEILANSKTPPPFDTVEIYNPNPEPVDISGWYLTDDFGRPAKYRFPQGSIIQPYGFFVVDETQFNPVPGVEPSFALGADGDEIYIFSADSSGKLTGYYHGLKFGASDNGETIGRFITTSGEEHFVIQSQPTLGTTNSTPRIGPVVITEIYYNPPGNNTNNFSEVFVELANITTNNVDLFLSGKPNYTWQLTNGIEYVFPTNITLSPLERIIVVSFNPTSSPAAILQFRSKYNIPQDVRIFGPFNGRLNNNDDIIELTKPIELNNGNIAYATVDKVHYKDELPWPVAADGLGMSLQKMYEDKYGNDAANWTGAEPTPGRMRTVFEPVEVIVDATPRNIVIQSNITLVAQVTSAGDWSYQWRHNGAILTGATNLVLNIPVAQYDDSGEYQLCVYGRNGSGASQPIRVNVVIPASIYAHPQSQGVFPYDPVTFSVVAVSTSPITYQWLFNGQPIPGATNSTYSIPSAWFTNAGEYVVLVTDATATIAAQPAILTVYNHPVITVQPQSRSVQPGSNVTFSVTAISKTPIRYQWRFNGVILEGQTNSTLTISNAQLSHVGEYTVIVTDDYGSIESDPANLIVLVRPSIIQQPTPSAVVAYVGEDVYFSIGATGLMPIGYRWRLNGATFAHFLINSTNSTLLITNVQFTNAGYYDCAITNAAGNAPGISARAYLAVMEPLKNAIVRPGSNAIFTFNIKPTSAASTPANMVLYYRWWFNFTNLIMTGATNTLVITNATYDKVGLYTVVATNQVGISATQSAYLIIREKPVIVKQPESRTAAVGETVSFTVVAEDAEPMLYQWYFNGEPLAYATAPVFTITNVTPTDAGDYFVVVYNDGGSVTSQVATLTVNVGDSDGDGMPDIWEQQFGLDTNKNDALDDKDGDGMPNLHEYIAGTDPSDPSSNLKIKNIALSNNELIITFDAAAEKSYALIGSTNFVDWETLTNIINLQSNHSITIKSPLNLNNKMQYFRIKIEYAK